MYRRLLFSLAAAALFTVPALGSYTTPAEANHSWNGYHWARTSNPFTLKLGDNVSSAWDPILATTSSDWSQSSVLDTTIAPGSTDPRKCRAASGQVQVCNAKYGNNGWLGIASVWINGLHITQGTVKLNDTYFNTATYNTTPWRNLVSCQEVGHTFGLDHQDTTFNNTNLGTCMDYTNNPLGPPDNEHPNKHDYDELVTIYSHLDSTTTIAALSPASSRSLVNDNEPGDGPKDWGRPVHKDAQGRDDVYERDLGGGNKAITHVFWALSGNGNGNGNENQGSHRP
jgi:hypothetical protein